MKPTRLHGSQKTRIFGLIAVLALFALAAPMPAMAKPDANLTAQQIVQRANYSSYYSGKDGRSKVKMTITDSQGRERRRELTILRLNSVVGPEAGKGSDQKYLVVFHRPADVRGMVFLVWKRAKGDDDRWLYLPALDLVKRIAAGDERTSFAGSDFFYEDVSGRGLQEDEHKRLPDEDGLYVIENTPKKPGSVEFASYKVWIDPETFIPMKGQYLDRSGKVYRTMEVQAVETIQGNPTVTKSKIADVGRGTTTILEFTGVKYDVGLPDKIFSERYLRRPPRKYLR